MIAGQVPTLDSKAGSPATRKPSGSQGRKCVTQEGGRSEEASVKRAVRGRGPGDMGGCCCRHALGSEQLPPKLCSVLFSSKNHVSNLIILKTRDINLVETELLKSGRRREWSQTHRPAPVPTTSLLLASEEGTFQGRQGPLGSPLSEAYSPRAGSLLPSCLLAFSFQVIKKHIQN